MTATVAASWVGLDPSLDLELLFRRYTDGTLTGATRQADTDEAWGPEIDLLPEQAGAVAENAGRCQCQSTGCSDAAFWQTVRPIQVPASNSEARKRQEGTR